MRQALQEARSEDIILPQCRGLTFQYAAPAFALLAGCILFGIGSIASAAAALPQISDAVKDGPSPSRDDVQQINQTVAAVVKTLADGSDPIAQQDARNWLIQSVMDGAGNSGSAAYLQAYSQIVNDQLLGVVSDPNANIRAKEQAGLAAQRIAQTAHTTDLVPLALKLLSDPSPIACYVGMKAADGLLPEVLNKAQLSDADHQLLTQIIAAVAQHPDPPLGGPIAEEAYDAFLQPVLGNVRGNAGQIIHELAPAILTLEEERLKLYQSAAPQSPQADATGLVILLSREIWLGGVNGPGLNVAQQKQALQIAADLISLSAKWAQAAPKPLATELLSGMETIGKELNLFADPATGVAPDGDLNDAATRLAGLGVNAGADAIGPAADNASEAVQKFLANIQ